MIRIPVKTTNPNNGSQGFSRGAAMSKARSRKKQRGTARLYVRSLGKVVVLSDGWVLMASSRDPVDALTITVTRVAPSEGLDPHDGLGAALKGCIDGIADALGMRNDRDPRVTWVLAQRRGEPKVYAVEVRIEARP